MEDKAYNSICNLCKHKLDNKCEIFGDLAIFRKILLNAKTLNLQKMTDKA